MNFEEHQDQITKEEEEVTEKIPYAKRRYDLCKQCDSFNNKLKICNECYCFMAFKVRLQDSQCPRGKW